MSPASSIRPRGVDHLTLAFGSLLVSVCLLVPMRLVAQVEDSPRLRVFLDCQTAPCDFDHFRREILFADWVRDRESADVHVLVTGQATGGGGTEFTLTLLERPDPSARTDTIVFATRDTDTEFEVREQLTQVLALGLVRYAVQAGVIEHLRVAYEPDESGLWPRVPANDPWDGWVFRVDGIADLAWSSPASNQRSWTYDLSGGVSVSRVTNALKLEFDGLVDRYRDETTVTLLGEETMFQRDGQRWSSAGLLAASLGEHWALGGQYGVDHTTADDFNGERSEWSVGGGPVVEYNVFPYRQSTRRLLALRVSAGPAFRRFDGQGLFGPETEWRAVSSLALILAQQQPWGEASVRAAWSAVLSDLGDHRLSATAVVAVRVYRGLAVNLWGNAYRIAGPFHASGTSTDRRYGYTLSFGPSFRFGSAYNNVVNPRFR